MRVWPGQPYPLGTTWTGLGIHFAIFSSHATQYPLQGGMLVLFTLDDNGWRHRASDQAGVADEIALG